MPTFADIVKPKIIMNALTLIISTVFQELTKLLTNLFVLTLEYNVVLTNNLSISAIFSNSFRWRVILVPYKKHKKYHLLTLGMYRPFTEDLKGFAPQVLNN